MRALCIPILVLLLLPAACGSVAAPAETERTAPPPPGPAPDPPAELDPLVLSPHPLRAPAPAPARDIESTEPPGSLAAQLLEGRRLVTLGRNRKAETLLEQAVRRWPGQAAAWYVWAMAATARHDRTAALTRLDRALGLDPANREILLAVALVHFQSRDYPEAGRAFDAVLRTPAEEGKIVSYDRARRLYHELVREGRLEVSFPEALERNLLPVDRVAMTAAWYARLASVLERGPELDPVFVAETEHYHVMSDYTEGFAHLVAHGLESMLAEYRKLFPPPEGWENEPKYRVTVFTRRGDYVRYLTEVLDDSRTPHLSSGSYHPLFKELLLTAGQGLEESLLLVYHEGFHQYMDSVFSDLPPWFNEGLADYFGASRQDGSRVILGGLHPHRQKALAAALREAARPPLERVLTASADEFLASGVYDLRRRAEVVSRNYALSWAFVHFLIHSDGGRRRPLLLDYYRALREGQSETEAYAGVFAPLAPRLASEFAEYARTRLLSS